MTFPVPPAMELRSILPAKLLDSLYVLRIGGSVFMLGQAPDLASEMRARQDQGERARMEVVPLDLDQLADYALAPRRDERPEHAKD